MVPNRNERKLILSKKLYDLVPLFWNMHMSRSVYITFQNSFSWIPFLNFHHLDMIHNCLPSTQSIPINPWRYFSLLVVFVAMEYMFSLCKWFSVDPTVFCLLLLLVFFSSGATNTCELVPAACLSITAMVNCYSASTTIHPPPVRTCT